MTNGISEIAARPIHLLCRREKGAIGFDRPFYILYNPATQSGDSASDTKARYLISAILMKAVCSFASSLAR